MWAFELLISGGVHIYRCSLYLGKNKIHWRLCCVSRDLLLVLSISSSSLSSSCGAIHIHREIYNTIITYMSFNYYPTWTLSRCLLSVVGATDRLLCQVIVYTCDGTSINIVVYGFWYLVYRRSFFCNTLEYINPVTYSDIAIYVVVAVLLLPLFC